MEEKQIIKKTEEYVRSRLQGEGSGHDWWHVHHVWKTAVLIGKEEQADLFVVQLAALLHDIADWKFHQGNDEIGLQLVKEWLEKLEVEEKTIAHVCEIIRNISFRGAKVKNTIKTKEGKIVQDADRLDALGAIGISRTFAYGGHKGREIYNPDLPPEKHLNFEQYKNSTGPTINHFYEKLLLLKDLMNTETGRRIAEKRHLFMEQFLERFYQEWDGRDV